MKPGGAFGVGDGVEFVAGEQPYLTGGQDDPCRHDVLVEPAVLVAAVPRSTLRQPARDGRRGEARRVETQRQVVLGQDGLQVLPDNPSLDGDGLSRGIHGEHAFPPAHVDHDRTLGRDSSPVARRRRAARHELQAGLPSKGDQLHERGLVARTHDPSREPSGHEGPDETRDAPHVVRVQLALDPIEGHVVAEDLLEPVLCRLIHRVPPLCCDSHSARRKKPLSGLTRASALPIPVWVY